MTYKIKIRPKALKFIEKQDNKGSEFILLFTTCQMVMLKKWWVVKIHIGSVYGSYRIIYELNQNNLIILVTKASNRGQIYK